MEVKKTVDIDFERYFSAGEILKPEFDDIKRKLNHVIEKEYDGIKHRNRPIAVQENYNDLWYFNASITTIPSLKKKIKDFESGNEYEREIFAFYVKYATLSENFKRLKSIVKTTTQKRLEQKEKVSERRSEACRVDPLVKALVKHHDEFVTKAKEAAGKHYDAKKKYLSDNGGLDKVAPYPNANKMDRNDFRYELERRNSYSEVVKYTKEEYVSMHGKAAHEDYMAWIFKMVEKVGKKVVEASLKGDPWVDSVLVVKTEDGEEQTWHTQMIINMSKYGKLFNQFPSRRWK